MRYDLTLKTAFARREFEILYHCLRIEMKNIDSDEIGEAITDYYNNLPWYKSLSLRLGIIKTPPVVEAWKEILEARKKGEKLVDIVE